MRKSIRSFLTGAVIAAAVSLGSGCQTTQRQDMDFAYRLGLGIDVGAALNSASVSLPESFGNVPPHPDDPGSATKKVNLTSGSYMSGHYGLSVSPLPINDFLSGFQVGYRKVFSNDNDTRMGLSKMEWYEHGAYAGTYVRVRMDSIDQFRFSYRQQLPLSDSSTRARFLLEGGISCNILNASVEDGWDRYYKEEARRPESFNAKSFNPFASIGFGFGMQNEEGALIFLNAFYENTSFKGNVSDGPVKIENNTLGFSARLGF